MVCYSNFFRLSQSSASKLLAALSMHWMLVYCTRTFSILDKSMYDMEIDFKLEEGRYVFRVHRKYLDDRLKPATSNLVDIGVFVKQVPIGTIPLHKQIFIW